MPYRKIQNWIIAFAVLLGSIGVMTWLAVRAYKNDLANFEYNVAVRDAYNDTIFTASAAVDTALWRGYKSNRMRIEHLERLTNGSLARRDSLAWRLHQIDAAMEAQARAIRNLR